MLTLQQSYEVRASILEYLKATYGFKEKAVAKAFKILVEDEQEGMFKGPYLSLKLPFVKCENGEDLPLEIKPPFPPFDHQVQSFRRLTSRNGHDPKPTILTTGTGSGKTESFLYPVLDYCYQHLDRRGIKCIILYPMNALATDQANRLAKAIEQDSRLKGKLTAGLFIGVGKDGQKFPKTMGATHIIENRESILSSPPDILLTNFKMLDYALMRSLYHSIWKYNLDDPSLLRFLVLDELHTYDGAQGTDVANLIRRLKLKLNMEPGQLCPIGTSATIGSGEDAPTLLAEYASKVFGEEITEAAIVTEKRLETGAFFGKEKKELSPRLPTPYKLQFTRLNPGESYESYLQRQLDIWQIDPSVGEVAVGRELKDLRLLWDIIDLCSSGMLTINELVKKLNHQNEEFRHVPEWDAAHQFSPKEAIIRSILSLVSKAKTETDIGNGTIKLPFLYLQVQLWVRELSGIVRCFTEEPAFMWRHHSVGDSIKAFPPYFCRECGASGWLMVKHDNRNNFENDISDINTKYFTNHKNVFLVNTDSDQHKHIDDYQPTETLHTFVNEENLRLNDKNANGRLGIFAYRSVKHNRNEHICPECNSKNTLSIMGGRVSTLTSVATSQLLASDLDSQTEKDRKLLVFANGVQDAAHLAGYVEARNYRFSFRTALQKVINQQEGIVSLSELQEQFIKYWKEHSDDSGKKSIEAYLYKFFPTDRSGDVKINSYLLKSGGYKEPFVREFDERMRWEIASEFGFNAIIGRTLEKTGSSAIRFKTDSLKKVYPLLQPWMDENLNNAIKKDDFDKFLLGFLHRIRMRGGINHEYLSKYRTGSYKLWDLNWMRDKRHYLNKRYGPRSRFPKILTDKVETRGVLDSTYTQKSNWFHAYYHQCFQLAPTFKDTVNEFFTKLVKTLAEKEVGLLDDAFANGINNYCLNPVIIEVGNKVMHMECDDCGHRLSVEASSADELTGARCLQHRCKGFYSLSEIEEADRYYRQVYNRERSPRVYAADHTGLLDRKVREKVEHDFKERPHFYSLNALIATSTLEMGIDIGDLNVTMNSSIPPLPSNYLQRIGRAGRKSGSALIVNFVSQRKPHDLYYFEEPKEMMEGRVSTPGCYLEAREILKRHYLAYCIDSWTSSDVKGNVIPGLVRFLKLTTLNLDDPQFFINRILHFIKTNEQSLLLRFKVAYDDQVNEQIFRELEHSFINEQFYLFPKTAFRRLKEEYQLIQQKRKEIDGYIKEKKLAKEDDERKELENEKRNLYGTLKSIEKRSVLEFMTNVGLLPNYAFPETGVTLNARVTGYKSEDADNPPPAKDIELVRPAKQAIKELLPDGHFYTQGYKLKISGLNVISWKEESEVFRFCSNCDHIIEDVKSEKTPCPKCNHDSWSSASNKHNFLKLHAVKSFNNESKAKLDDSSEEREQKMGQRSYHMHFYPESVHGAYALKNIPFGIEYVREVNIIETNAGIISDYVDRNRTATINEKEVPVSGYITCRYCGLSSSSTHREKERGMFLPKEAKDYHYPYCKHKTKAYDGRSDDVFEEVYLYRSMKTEALKILLPVQEFDSESMISMFKAGLELGLKSYYKGNPQHLELKDYAEYNHLTRKMDRYLVMYDVIPGGTGYLEKLFDKKEFTDILKLAYQGIRDCNCQHLGKDGCYHCIYTYGNQYFREELSRQKAEKLFEKIIQSIDSWENFPNGLGNITNTGYIEESELEERFIRALRNFTLKEENQNLGCRFEEYNQDGVINYRLTLANKQNKLTYQIQPQYRLGPANGVELVTLADFSFHCIAANINGVEISGEELHGFLPIVIYLDGYQYHASKENPRFENDLKKRRAIQQSGKYLSWTMTWDDIGQFEEKASDILSNTFLKNTKTREFLKRMPKYKAANNQFIGAHNNFQRLIWLLQFGSFPDHNDFRSNFRFLLAGLQDDFGKQFNTEEDAKHYVETGELRPSVVPGKEGLEYFPVSIPFEQTFASIRMMERLKDLGSGANISIAEHKGGYPKDEWDTFWKLFNLFQVEDSLEIIFESDPEEKEVEITISEKDEIFNYYDEEYHEIIKQLLEKEIDFTKEGSFELMENKEIIAEAVLGFPSAKIVIEPYTEEDEIIFNERGYVVWTPIEFDIKKIT